MATLSKRIIMNDQVDLQERLSPFLDENDRVELILVSEAYRVVLVISNTEAHLLMTPLAARLAGTTEDQFEQITQEVRVIKRRLDEKILNDCTPVMGGHTPGALHPADRQPRECIEIRLWPSEVAPAIMRAAWGKWVSYRKQKRLVVTSIGYREEDIRFEFRPDVRNPSKKHLAGVSILLIPSERPVEDA